MVLNSGLSRSNYYDIKLVNFYGHIAVPLEFSWVVCRRRRMFFFLTTCEKRIFIILYNKFIQFTYQQHQLHVKKSDETLLSSQG